MSHKSNKRFFFYIGYLIYLNGRSFQRKFVLNCRELNNFGVRNHLEGKKLIFAYFPKGIFPPECFNVIFISFFFYLLVIFTILIQFYY